MNLLAADRENLSQSVYNINCVDFSPSEMIEKFMEYFPKFTYDYNPDIRDKFTSTWPYNYDDSLARKEWGWNPQYDSLEKIVDVMYERVMQQAKESNTIGTGSI